MRFWQKMSAIICQKRLIIIVLAENKKSFSAKTTLFQEFWLKMIFETEKSLLF